MYTASVYAIYPCCLRDVCYDGDEERDGNVLEYERPGPLIKICQPLPTGLQEDGRTYTIPCQATIIAFGLLQSIEKPISHLWFRHYVSN